MNTENYKMLVSEARSSDLMNYFQTSGYTLQKHGSEFYVDEIPGLCIKPDTNQWYHHYTNQGGTNNSVDCLTKSLGMSFNQAVFELTGQDISTQRSSSYSSEHRPQITSPPRKSEPIKKELVMPEQSENMRRLFAYLCLTRKIPAPIVEELVHSNLLYQTNSQVNAVVNGESKKFENANAVFVHCNNAGEVVGAEIQGLNSYKRYKGVATGTGESCFRFTPIKDTKITKAYIFESAIDLMSFYAFCDKNKLNGVTLISMAGLKPTVPKRLQEDGVEIISCVDNDDAGRKFESENNFERNSWVKSKLDEKGFKDWNELLVFTQENRNTNMNEDDSQNATKITRRR